jgi:hypothetical protein
MTKLHPWKKQKTEPELRAGFQRVRWHAVSIVTTQASCHTARALRGMRFLSNEAPHLPLTECCAGATCPCAYKHYADRRGPPRRAEELTGLRRPNPGAQERRQQSGRRSTDF